MRVLLTRPREQAEEMAQELRAMGHEVIVSPLSKRQVIEVPGELDGIGALVFTSVNGVSAMTGQIPGGLLSVPVFAVGKRTAVAATRAGFSKIIAGPGRARDLVPMIIGFAGEINGRIVHISGDEVHSDVAALLQAAGRSAERLNVYRMVVQDRFSDEALAAIRERQLDALLFFSHRSARLFVTLAEAEGLAADLGGALAIALSDDVAEPLGVISWAGIRVAARPDREAIYEQLLSRNK